MSILSEDVKTVISCQSLTAQNVYTDQLTSGSLVTDNIATNILTLVDPLDSTKIGTLEENGNTLDITSPIVQINGNVVVTGTLTLPVNPPNVNGYYSGTIVVNDLVPPHTHTLVFTTGLLKTYTYL